MSENLDSELDKIKKEMQEIKEMLKQKVKDTPPSSQKKQVRVIFNKDDFDIDVNVDDITSTFEDYVESIVDGIEFNLKNAMDQMSSAFRTIKIDKNRKIKFREKNKEDDSASIKYHNLGENELELFYKDAPHIMNALSDTRRLKIMKILEQGPMYQTDLSDMAEVKGGTLKHHLDILIDVGFVYQEQARGRYLITQFGIEALKLVEVLFRRYSRNATKSDNINDTDEDSNSNHDNDDNSSSFIVNKTEVDEKEEE